MNKCKILLILMLLVLSNTVEAKTAKWGEDENNKETLRNIKTVAVIANIDKKICKPSWVNLESGGGIVGTWAALTIDAKTQEDIENNFDYKDWDKAKDLEDNFTKAISVRLPYEIITWREQINISKDALAKENKDYCYSAFLQLGVDYLIELTIKDFQYTQCKNDYKKMIDMNVVNAIKLDVEINLIDIINKELKMSGSIKCNSNELTIEDIKNSNGKKLKEKYALLAEEIAKRFMGEIGVIEYEGIKKKDIKVGKTKNELYNKKTK